jgi:hypothetical protein
MPATALPRPMRRMGGRERTESNSSFAADGSADIGATGGGQLALKSVHWPRLPHALSGRLKRMAPALRAWGITFDNALVGRERKRMIYIDVQTETFSGRSSPSTDVEVYETCEVEIDPPDLEATSVTPPKTASAPSAPSADMTTQPTPPEPPKRQGTVVRKPVPKETTTAVPSPADVPGGEAAGFEPAVKGHFIRKPARPVDAS